MSKLAEMTACELKPLLEQKEISCVEILRSVLAEIAAKESDIHAFITLRAETDLLAEAEAIDLRRARGEIIGPLAGLPIAIKDSICTKGLRTTAGSRMLEKFLPPYDATVIRRIREADGVILGKTNLDEFCMGSSTENSAYNPTHNPHDLTRVPGGTSGGSAAAVAANMTVLALGSDTGGSVRQPASFCGTVGFKPTYGRVSRFGLIAYGSSLDQIGPITKSVEDAALLLSVISGHDPLDSTSLAFSPISSEIAPLHDKLRVGIPKEYFGEGQDPEVRKCIESALDHLVAQGHTLVPVSLPHTEYAIPVYYLIACAEASANLARFDGIRYGYRSDNANGLLDTYLFSRSEGFGEEVKRRIVLGTYILSAGYYDAYYLKAQKVRTLIRQDFERAFRDCDVIANPVAPTPAFRLGENLADPLTMYLQDIYSVIANLAGTPAISIPCGFSEQLPIGIQITGPAASENLLLSLTKTVSFLTE